MFPPSALYAIKGVMHWVSAPRINAFHFPVSVNRPEVLRGELSKASHPRLSCLPSYPAASGTNAH